MKRMTQLKTTALAVGILVATVLQSDARPPMRKHTATKAEELSVVTANQKINGSKVVMQIQGSTRIIKSNGLPGHAVGRFPNRGNPNRISAQSYVFKMTVSPKMGRASPLRRAAFGVAVNGVPFDPNAAEFWQGDPKSGWNYNALGGAVALGLDANFAHVQPTGAYHYHGLPVGLMQQLGWRSGKHSPLIGYAADGFPIYALTGEINDKVVRMTSSYRLKSGNRPGGNKPSGQHDGAFMQDFRYIKGAGHLDECNGAQITSPEYPNGTYAYFLTDTYPVIPRCLRGKAGSGFSKR